MSAQPDRAALGRRSRDKGKAFELVVRDLLTDGLRCPTCGNDGHVPADVGERLCPDCQGGMNLVIRRSSQAERAWESDLVIEGAGVPQWLCDLWVECEHANAPDPKAKHLQACRDAARATMRTGRIRLPVVVWRRTGSRTVSATIDLSWLIELAGGAEATTASPGHGVLVTLELSALLTVLRARRG